MEAAGRDYRYMMVFEKKEFQHDGAYTLDEFAEVIKKGIGPNFGVGLLHECGST